MFLHLLDTIYILVDNSRIGSLLSALYNKEGRRFVTLNMKKYWNSFVFVLFDIFSQINQVFFVEITG